VRPAQVVARATDYLARHGVESPRETAESLLAFFLRTDRVGLYGRTDGLDTRTARLFGRALCQRCHGVPLQYLTGEQQFFDLVLGVAPGVFVPRPETETLVQRALEILPEGPAVAVDVGTGTGAIALALKRFRPRARVLATDLSEDAVAVARANASRHGLDIEVLPGDLLGPIPEDLRGRISVVVSNPPYVTREEYHSLPDEVRAEPYEALVGGTDLHRRLAQEASSWLHKGGWLVMEIGASQAEEVVAVLTESFESVEVLPDLAGRDRVVRGRLPG
jgi:release factor glutamine methyltransferase